MKKIINVTPLNAFDDRLLQLLERCKMCVADKGNYFWRNQEIILSFFMCVCSYRLRPRILLFDKSRNCNFKIL